VSVKRFRQRVVAVEAIQLTPANIEDVAAWVGDSAMVYTGRQHGHTDPPFTDHSCMSFLSTSGSDMSAYAGDWVVKDASGEARSFPPEDFAAIYEAVTENEDQQ
jgi:hypothetical protein